MNRDTLKRLKLTDQPSADPLKLFSLIEKSVLAYILIGLVFIIMRKTGLIEASLGSSIACGTIGYLVIATKLIYHDEALSELRTHANIDPDKLKIAMLAIDYSEKKDGVYYPNKKTLSIFYFCKSEIITYKTNDETAIFTGPHNRLLRLSNLIA